jgi:hypothetical protein
MIRIRLRSSVKFSPSAINRSFAETTDNAAVPEYRKIQRAPIGRSSINHIEKKIRIAVIALPVLVIAIGQATTIEFVITKIRTV